MLAIHPNARTTPARFTDHPGHGPKAGHALTFTPDHPVGAGHYPIELLGFRSGRETAPAARQPNGALKD